MSTFAHDATLAPLPVPELGGTCQYLKQLIRPLVDDTDFAEVCAAIDALEQTQGVPLQALLEQTAHALPHNASWLRPIWDDMYLGFRDMLPVNMNYCFQFAEKAFGEDSLASLISGLTLTIQNMRTESLPPEAAREAFFSMDTLAYMLHTRIPGKIKDVWYHVPLSAPPTASVICQGHFFILSLTDEAGKVLSPAAVAGALTDIRAQAAAMPAAKAPIGAFTCYDRETACEQRDMLLSQTQNRFSLASIEKTLFTVCLDAPLSEQENFNLNLICGKAENRFFDKSLQIISDGTHVGANIEHSSCDAGIWVYLLNQVYARTQAGITDCSDAVPCVRALSWSLSDAEAQALAQTETLYNGVRRKLSMGDRCIASLSRSQIKTMQCSPDAFVQLLYQIAYYKLRGCFGSVYEAVSTRAFYEGRTECVRPITSESTAFVRAFCGDASQDTLKEALAEALAAHGGRIKRAQQALGAERHLSGLASVAAANGIALPDVFQTKGYQLLKHDAMSTSSTTAPYIHYFCFGPVVLDGIGVGYGVKEDGLHIAVSSYGDSRISPAIFLDEMEQAASRLYELFA